MDCANKKRTFVQISDNDIDDLLNNKYSQNTKRNVNGIIKILEKFLLTKWPNKLLLDLTENELNDLLAEYYPSIRKLNGDAYMKGSYESMYYSIKHFFRENKQYDLNSVNFYKSNSVFQGMMKVIKKIGKGNVNHYPLISHIDLEKVFANLSTKTPKELQWITWFYIQYHFCRRGNENVTFMTKDTFQVIVIDGNKCLVPRIDEMTKNSREKDNECAINGRIYETFTENCPVATYEKYVSKLNPDCHRLWQKAKNNTMEVTDSNCWYYKVPLGVHTLSKFMKEISAHTTLSKIYTNHSIRVTAITTLGARFTENEIMTISGHKSIASLGLYKRISEQCKRNMSLYLTSSLISDNKLPGKIFSNSEEGNADVRDQSLSMPSTSKNAYNVDLDSTMPCSSSQNSVETSTPKANALQENKKLLNAFHINSTLSKDFSFESIQISPLFTNLKSIGMNRNPPIFMNCSNITINNPIFNN